MKFKELYPQPKRLTLGPTPEVYPDIIKYPDLSCGGGSYDCWVCKKPTNWHITTTEAITMVCSTECLEVINKPLDPTPNPVV
jgi:hypothetical protein